MREPPGYTRISSEWTAADRRGAVRCRLGKFRMRYRVEPGLYALDRPDEDSAVLVTASYRLGFDLLRRDLRGFSCWILVLDTAGINVWCAAGAGTFSTEELVARAAKARLDEVVRHRTIILPQLGATGVSGPRVQQYAGFTVRFGPVRSADLPAYLSNECTATPPMRAVSFSTRERLTLVPMEIGQSLMRFPAFAFAALIFSGIGSGGVNLGRALGEGWPLLALGLGSVLSGSFLLPLLLPLIPLRAFSARGWILGGWVTAALLHAAGLAAGMDPFRVAGCYLFFPAASAFMALGFTGATPFTSHAGVRREIRWFIPFAAAAALLTAAALTLSKLRQAGVL
jgi:hypothetical protein